MNDTQKLIEQQIVDGVANEMICEWIAGRRLLLDIEQLDATTDPGPYAKAVEAYDRWAEFHPAFDPYAVPIRLWLA